jgi:hypothetical protein
MNKFSLFLITTFFVCQNTYGQTERFGDEKEDPKPATTEQPTIKPPARQPVKPSFWERTRFGGNFGAGFGNGFSFVNVSPRMYYLATEKLWLGTGVTFIWSKDNYYPPPFDQQFVYGFNLSAQYMLFGPIFVQAEYEPLSFERVSVNPISGEFAEERVWAQGLLLGGGISQPMGRGRFFASVLYNVTWTSDINSYYYSPWVFRIGFGI